MGVRLGVDRGGDFLVDRAAGLVETGCHTNPSYAVGGNPYLGQLKKVNAAHYLGGGQAFGPFISRNLTPENGLPAGRTLQEFKAIMRTGVDYDKQTPLLQVMPWPTYQTMSDHDLNAMYEYLRSIPSATPGT